MTATQQQFINIQSKKLKNIMVFHSAFMGGRKNLRFMVKKEYLTGKE